MGLGKFFNAVAKAAAGSATPSPGKSQASGKLGFQETGTPPKRDGQGRVIVKLKGGAGAAWGVNLSRLEDKVANKLAGKVNADEEFSKTVKVRMRPDKESQFDNSVLIETLDGQFVGWILKDASEDIVSVMAQIRKGVSSVAPELAGDDFTFEMSAKIEGYWDEVGEDEKEEWEASVDSMFIQMKNPAEIEVE